MWLLHKYVKRVQSFCKKMTKTTQRCSFINFLRPLRFIIAPRILSQSKKEIESAISLQNGKKSLVTFALRLYNSYNHVHAPGPQMSPSPGPWPDSKCSKTVEVDVHVKG